MKDFIVANGGLVASLALAIYCINAVLSGVKLALDKVKDVTESKLDNKIAEVIGVVCSVLGKALDLLLGNPEHK